jgi:hypothetical protein
MNYVIDSFNSKTKEDNVLKEKFTEDGINELIKKLKDVVKNNLKTDNEEEKKKNNIFFVGLVSFVEKLNSCVLNNLDSNNNFKNEFSTLINVMEKAANKFNLKNSEQKLEKMKTKLSA